MRFPLIPLFAYSLGFANAFVIPETRQVAAEHGKNSLGAATYGLHQPSPRALAWTTKPGLTITTAKKKRAPGTKGGTNQRKPQQGSRKSPAPGSKPLGVTKKPKTQKNPSINFRWVRQPVVKTTGLWGQKGGVLDVDLSQLAIVALLYTPTTRIWGSVSYGYLLAIADGAESFCTQLEMKYKKSLADERSRPLVKRTPQKAILRIEIPSAYANKRLPTLGGKTMPQYFQTRLSALGAKIDQYPPGKQWVVVRHDGGQVASTYQVSYTTDAEHARLIEQSTNQKALKVGTGRVSTA